MTDDARERRRLRRRRAAAGRARYYAEVSRAAGLAIGTAAILSGLGIVSSPRVDSAWLAGVGGAAFFLIGLGAIYAGRASVLEKEDDS